MWHWGALLLWPCRCATVVPCPLHWQGVRLGIMAHLQHELDIPAAEVQCVCLQELFSCFFQLILRQFLGLRPEFAPALQITISAVVLQQCKKLGTEYVHVATSRGELHAMGEVLPY